MLRILLGLTLLVIIFLAALYPMVYDKTAETRMIYIPAGATSQTVRDTLTRYYGESYAAKVMRLAKIRNIDFAKRHGAYEVPAGSTPLSTMRRIGRSGQTPVKLTINGFRDIDLLCRRIAARLEFTPDSLRRILDNPETLKPYGLKPEQALALFIDDTYEVFWTSSPRDVIEKIGRNYLTVWNDSRRHKADVLGLSPAEAMTLASIVDEETNSVSEKGIIGRLYLNRLNRGMRLQSDPTIRFALKDYTIRRVRANHLKVDSPYNTYTNSGLPPGPIRTTGQATIDRILQSEPNNYLYMCAKEDFSGTHNFAVTFAEHSANAARYRRALDKKNIL